MQGFGSRVLAHDLERNPAVEELGAEYVSREQLLRESDVISLHLPLVPSTRNILCAERHVSSPACRSAIPVSSACCLL